MHVESGQGALTENDVDAVVLELLKSDYICDEYANWPLDRRLVGFLEHSHLGRVADNGDAFAAIVDRIMTCIGHHGSTLHPPTPPL